MREVALHTGLLASEEMSHDCPKLSRNVSLTQREHRRWRAAFPVLAWAPPSRFDVGCGRGLGAAVWMERDSLGRPNFARAKCKLSYISHIS